MKPFQQLTTDQRYDEANYVQIRFRQFYQQTQQRKNAANTTNTTLREILKKFLLGFEEPSYI